jgi:hypothetical protein
LSPRAFISPHPLVFHATLHCNPPVHPLTPHLPTRSPPPPIRLPTTYPPSHPYDRCSITLTPPLPTSSPTCPPPPFAIPPHPLTSPSPLSPLSLYFRCPPSQLSLTYVPGPALF